MRARHLALLPLLPVLVVTAGCAAAVGRPATVADPRGSAVMAVVDSAMRYINSGAVDSLSDLMVPEAQVFIARETPADGGTMRIRTVAQQRATGRRAPIIERGYDPTVRVSGTVASVWLPYDLWAEGKWSHCGVDHFTLVQIGRGWRIVNLTYTIEQPPACRMHPDGPPPGYAPPPTGTRQ